MQPRFAAAVVAWWRAGTKSRPRIGAEARVIERWGIFVGLVLGSWLCWRAISPSIPHGVDSAFHLARSEHAFDHHFATGRTDGWNPTFAMGAQNFLVYGPGVAIVFAALKVLTFGLIGDSGVYAALVACAYIATVPSVSFLIRSLGLGIRTANLAGILALGISCNFGLGIQGTWYWGLVPHQVAVHFVCLGIGATVRSYHEPARRWIVLAGVSFAALAVTHLQSAMAAAMLLVMLAPGIVHAQRPNRRTIARLGGIGMIAFGCAAFWLIPFLQLNGPRGLVATWPTPPFGERVDQVMDGTELFARAAPEPGWLTFGPIRFDLAAAVTFGMLVQAWRIVRRRRHPLALTLAVGPVLLWALMHAYYSSNPTADVARLLANRTLPYIGVFLLIPVAVGLSIAANRLRPWGDTAVLAIALLLVAVPLEPSRVNAVAQQPSAAMWATAEALRDLVPEHRRFLYVHVDVGTELALGVGHPGVWLAHHSERATANGYGSETVTRFYTNITHEFSTLAPAIAAEWLTRMRVTHVVTVTDASRLFVDGLPGTEPVWTEGAVTILSVTDPVGFAQPDTMIYSATPIDVTAESLGPEAARWRFSAAEPTRVTVGVAWFEKWHASVNGSPVEPLLVDGLMAFDLAGSGVLELRYRDSSADYLGRVVSLFSLAGLSTWAIRTRRRQPRGRALTADRTNAPRDIIHEPTDANVT